MNWIDYTFIILCIGLLALSSVAIVHEVGESPDPYEPFAEIMPEPELEEDADLPEFDADLFPDQVRELGNLGPMNSILISQRGELVTSNYFRGMNQNRTHNIKSASKSILSILTGIAIEKGYLDGVDQPIGPFFPEYFGPNPDPEKEAITIEDLLTMRSGLQSTSRANYGSWVVSNNWIWYALNRPLVGTPGVDRHYSTGNTHLLAVIITRASGMNMRQFSDKYLFGPMNIRIGGWDRDPQGYYFGGNNMAMRPSDMIKVGQMMMNAGVYNGEKIVSSEWIRKSIEPVTGRISDMENYGYLWFRESFDNLETIYAFGNGGQYIFILPEIESVITVTTRNNAAGTRNYRRELFRVLQSDIVPLLKQRYNAV
ncbi:MAG: serine hydrolase [Balneolaceae bacterium]|nr:serine hydrolase [Balneolaceae bacterium]MCH8547713.1 beta-lactamase family protein [Balneolaceae bacterium]